MKTIFFILFILPSFLAKAQGETNEAGINFRYEVIQDSVYCFLSAPTLGWVMVGFNATPSIKGADFKFFWVEEDTPKCSDRKNISGRNYPSDTMLGGQNNIHLVRGVENNLGSSFLFVLPLKTEESNDFQHHLTQQFWLILAYSTNDDLEHHSRVRKHLPFSWEPL